MPADLPVENPFSAPQTATAGAAVFHDDAPPDPLDVRYRMIGRVVVTWEKLRLVYNAILLGAVLLLALPNLPLLLQPAALGQLVLAALGANACFTAGPLVDGYLSWFGLRHRGVTIVLFVLGTAASIITAAIVLFSVRIVNQP